MAPRFVLLRLYSSWSVSVRKSVPRFRANGSVEESTRTSRLESRSPGSPAPFSALRWLLRSAFSRCLSCRERSFWRLVKLERPLPDIHTSKGTLVLRTWFGPRDYAAVIVGVNGNLPARIARLPGVPAIIVAASAITASATAASGTPKAASARAAAAAFLFRARLVDLHRTAPQITAIQGRDGLVGCAGIRHFHTRERARAPGITIRYNADSLDCAVRLE